MASQYGIERDRGAKESWQQIEVLREKWPLAFPVKPHDVRPLALGAADEIAAAMGWSVPYTRGVIVQWKMSPTYCRAVLCCDHRIALDGSPAEPIDAEAKELATKRLAALAARKAKKAEPTKPAKVSHPTPSPEPSKRDQVRAGLFRRSGGVGRSSGRDARR
jgi:sRNA-binding protein